MSHEIKTTTINNAHEQNQKKTALIRLDKPETTAYLKVFLLYLFGGTIITVVLSIVMFFPITFISVVSDLLFIVLLPTSWIFSLFFSVFLIYHMLIDSKYRKIMTRKKLKIIGIASILFLIPLVFFTILIVYILSFAGFMSVT